MKKNLEQQRDPRGRELLEKDEPRIDETTVEFLDEPIRTPKGKWVRDKFGDEHYVGGASDREKKRTERRETI